MNELNTDLYYCPNCGAILNSQKGFDPDLSSWTCLSCGQFLFDESISDDETDIVWFCDRCGDLLNKQDGFSLAEGEWICSKCGHIEHFEEVFDVSIDPSILGLLSTDEEYID